MSNEEVKDELRNIWSGGVEVKAPVGAIAQPEMEMTTRNDTLLTCAGDPQYHWDLYAITLPVEFERTDKTEAAIELLKELGWAKYVGTRPTRRECRKEVRDFRNGIECEWIECWFDAGTDHRDHVFVFFVPDSCRAGTRKKTCLHVLKREDCE